jgi:phenylpropionate dioxygenase-like ring-hydroxylating dioxygenase large terminal subunit
MRPINELVRADEGVVSREIFASQELFQQEQERIFSRAWLFVGHESLVPKGDDYFVSRMGTESVILTRDRQNRIHVLLNSCAHRGMKLCRYDSGNSRAFSCPYHGWSFSTDGNLVEMPGGLVGVPGIDTHYHHELDKKAWGLKRVAHVYNYKGSIWATWDPEAPPFLDYLGGMRIYLDSLLDHRDGRAGMSEVIGGIQKWRVNCNWKFPPENFIGDKYHDISHRSADLVGVGPSPGKGRRDLTTKRMCVAFPELGHGSIARLPHFEEFDYIPQYRENPEIEAYFRKVYEDRVRNLGDTMRATGQATSTIFPNMSFHSLQPRSIGVFHPISPTETEMWRIYLVDKDAPDAVKDATHHYNIRYHGPGGMAESDDMENWSCATEACQGTQCRTMHFNYQMGIGHTEPVPHLPDAVYAEFTEENARGFYRQWGRFMEGRSWSELRPGASRHTQEERAA